jgi:hypothetical protein
VVSIKSWELQPADLSPWTGVRPPKKEWGAARWQSVSLPRSQIERELSCSRTSLLPLQVRARALAAPCYAAHCRSNFAVQAPHTVDLELKLKKGVKGDLTTLPQDCAPDHPRAPGEQESPAGRLPAPKRRCACHGCSQTAMPYCCAICRASSAHDFERPEEAELQQAALTTAKACDGEGFPLEPDARLERADACCESDRLYWMAGDGRCARSKC